MIDFMLKRVPQLLRTSIAKKFIMAITGLLLVGFLVAHLAGNLLLYVGPQAYNAYAHKLHEQEWLIKIAEVGLALLFLAHIYLAVSTLRDNWSARRKNYARRESKRDLLLVIRADTWMFFSGAVVLGFVIWHLIDFTLQARPDFVYEGKEPFDKAVMILQNPATMAVYALGCLLLGAHLSHGVASAFQSLGWSSKRFRPFLQFVCIALSWGLALGFLSFLVWAQTQNVAPPKSTSAAQTIQINDEG